ncbi:hypothetical protein [Candidatus Phytoplasma pini]|uniref:Uncharacterized protein n=1 Tax=Candidatus Phytoplasma pini TaxID=267362 RepID=A0A559KJG2_9MOLU|nr:hypothetical protein [Candidatus Phytoplasma pini]TVY12273.1 hypothetical protein MDPP_00220 [Candidatus Phytoplasma pini]
MRTQIKNKVKIIFLIIICSFFTISSIHAITKYFTSQRTEQIKLMNENEFPVFNVARTGGNNNDKTLIPLSIPNFNKQKYDHAIIINHKATLNSNGMDLSTTPLLLKVAFKYDTHSTFNDPEKYFLVGSEVDNNSYDETKRPQMKLDSSGVGTLKIEIKVQQKDFITAKNPKLDLICDYELVDSNGKAYGAGSQTIKNAITNIA